MRVPPGHAGPGAAVRARAQKLPFRRYPSAQAAAPPILRARPPPHVAPVRRRSERAHCSRFWSAQAALKRRGGPPWATAPELAEGENCAKATATASVFAVAILSAEASVTEEESTFWRCDS
jgi:hypothetical protein